jgi:hypothetical protein
MKTTEIVDLGAFWRDEHGAMVHHGRFARLVAPLGALYS